MDPWSKSDSIDNSRSSDNCDSFEDNFKPTVCNSLPDSQQYLASLENKLLKIKSDPSIIKQLIDRREACLQQLLFNGADLISNETLVLDTPVPDSTLLRTVCPQRQALTVGELAELVKYDQLQKNLEEETEDSTSR